MSAGATPVPHSVNAWSAEYLEAQYERFRADPTSVPASMADFFRGFDLAMTMAPAAMPAASGGGGVALRAAGELPTPEPIAD